MPALCIEIRLVVITVFVVDEKVEGSCGSLLNEGAAEVAAAVRPEDVDFVVKGGKASLFWTW